MNIEKNENKSLSKKQLWLKLAGIAVSIISTAVAIIINYKKIYHFIKLLIPFINNDAVILSGYKYLIIGIIIGMAFAILLCWVYDKYVNLEKHYTDKYLAVKGNIGEIKMFGMIGGKKADILSYQAHIIDKNENKVNEIKKDTIIYPIVFSNDGVVDKKKLDDILDKYHFVNKEKPECVFYILRCDFVVYKKRRKMLSIHLTNIHQVIPNDNNIENQKFRFV